MELNTGLGFVVRRQVHFFHKFMISVGEGTFALEFALSEELPISAHLSLVLDLILSDEIFSLLFGGKMLFRLLNSSLFIVFVGGP